MGGPSWISTNRSVQKSVGVHFLIVLDHVLEFQRSHKSFAFHGISNCQWLIEFIDAEDTISFGMVQISNQWRKSRHLHRFKLLVHVRTNPDGFHQKVDFNHRTEYGSRFSQKPINWWISRFYIIKHIIPINPFAVCKSLFCLIKPSILVPSVWLSSFLRPLPYPSKSALNMRVRQVGRELPSGWKIKHGSREST